MSYSATLFRPAIQEFKATWPCHGLPDNLWRLWFQFEDNGDLCDLAAFARNGRAIDTEPFDGPAMVALCEMAQRLVRPEHADDRYARKN